MICGGAIPALIDSSASYCLRLAFLADRGEGRSKWFDAVLINKGWSSALDVEKHGGPTYNTIRRYLSGVKSTQDRAVRLRLAKAFGCSLDEVPE